MAKYLIEQSGNVNWMAIFAMLTFFTIFSVSVLMVFRKNNPNIRRLENLPLEDDE